MVNRPTPGFDELFSMLEQQMKNPHHQADEEHKQKKPTNEMWRAIIYQQDMLILDHAQADYAKVFRFTMQALAELHNQQVTDFRVTIQNQKGDVYFFAIGP